MVKVAIIGAGIVGLGTAVYLQRQNPSLDLTLISDEFSPNTTGDGAAGIWGPFVLGNTPEDKIVKWSGDTHNFFLDLWNSDIGGKVGISMLPCKRVSNEVTFPEPKWRTVVYGYRVMSKEELLELHIPNLTHGRDFVTFTCEPVKLLPYLLNQFQEQGGKVVKQHITDIQKLKQDYAVVVNCTGLNSRNLVSDKTLIPKRGHVIRVEAPEVSHSVLDESCNGNYIIPNQESVVLGGTCQENDWNRKPYPEDTKFIKEGCYRISPSLRNAKILKEWVGLRPSRPSLRLELETHHGTDGKPFHVVHNYGHGGSGITLFWGCAAEAASLVQQALEGSTIPNKKSKL